MATDGGCERDVVHRMNERLKRSAQNQKRAEKNGLWICVRKS